MHKQSKGAKICASIWWESVENAPELSAKHLSNPEGTCNSHIHKMGPCRPKHYIFGDHFCSKNARKLRFHVFLHFTAWKHMLLSFYLKWTKFKRNFEFVLFYFGSLWTHNWNKIHNFLWIRSTSGKIMMSCFLTWMYTWNLSFLTLFE